MSEPIIAAASRSSEGGAPTPIHCLYEDELAAFLEARASFVKGFVALEDFKAKAGQVLVLPTPQGSVDRVLLGLGAMGKAEAMLFRALPARLPAGDYRLASVPDGLDAGQIALAFALGAYKFDRYRPRKDEGPRR